MVICNAFVDMVSKLMDNIFTWMFFAIGGIFAISLTWGVIKFLFSFLLIIVGVFQHGTFEGALSVLMFIGLIGGLWSWVSNM